MWREYIGFPIPAVTKQYIEHDLLFHTAKRCAKLTMFSDKYKIKPLFEGIAFGPVTCVYVEKCDTITTHRITVFLDFFHHLVFYRTRRFGNWICFRPQVKVGEKTSTQLGPLERANLKFFLMGQLSRCLLPHLHLRTKKNPVSETSCSLEYQMMEKVPKPSNSVCYTPSSEPFSIYITTHI
jgi:hypothetical protein